MVTRFLRGLGTVEIFYLVSVSDKYASMEYFSLERTFTTKNCPFKDNVYKVCSNLNICSFNLLSHYASKFTRFMIITLRMMTLTHRKLHVAENSLGKWYRHSFECVLLYIRNSHSIIARINCNYRLVPICGRNEETLRRFKYWSKKDVFEFAQKKASVKNEFQ